MSITNTANVVGTRSQKLKINVENRSCANASLNMVRLDLHQHRPICRLTEKTKYSQPCGQHLYFYCSSSLHKSSGLHSCPQNFLLCASRDRYSKMSNTTQTQRPQPYRYSSVDLTATPCMTSAQSIEKVYTTESDVTEPLRTWYHDLDQQPPSLELDSLESYDRAYSVSRGRSHLTANAHRSKIRWWQIKRYIPRTKWMITFLAIVVIQTVVCSGLGAAIIHQGVTFGTEMWNGPTGYSSLGTFLFFTPELGVLPAVVLLVEILYQFFLTVDAGRRKNIVQIIGICFNNASILIMVVLAYYGTGSFFFAEVMPTFYSRHPNLQEINREFLAVAISIGVCGFLLALAAWRGFREFEW
jgi:hypothetical protein